MPTYRKIPLLVEAEQYLDGKLPHPKGLCLLLHNESYHPEVNEPHLHTIHEGQIVILENEDWILEEPDGIHYYPVKNNIFKESYEAVFKVS